MEDLRFEARTKDGVNLTYAVWDNLHKCFVGATEDVDLEYVNKIARIFNS